jgi:hypothetical protein
MLINPVFNWLLLLGAFGTQLLALGLSSPPPLPPPVPLALHLFFFFRLVMRNFGILRAEATINGQPADSDILPFLSISSAVLAFDATRQEWTLATVNSQVIASNCKQRNVLLGLRSSSMSRLHCH